MVSRTEWEQFMSVTNHSRHSPRYATKQGFQLLVNGLEGQSSLIITTLGLRCWLSWLATVNTRIRWSPSEPSMKRDLMVDTGWGGLNRSSPRGGSASLVF